LLDGSGNQADFGLGCDVGGKEGKAPIGSVARVNPKVTLAKGAICQCDNCWELRGRRKVIQLQEDLMPGGTGGHRVDPALIRW
jgi:hypothetical protein